MLSIFIELLDLLVWTRLNHAAPLSSKQHITNLHYYYWY